MDIQKFSNANDAAAAAGQALNNLLTSAKDQPVLLMLAAGSSLAILKEINPDLLAANLKISMLDERFSLDSKINNFLQLQQTRFYRTAEFAECGFIGTAARPGESREEFAARWEKSLRQWKLENPEGKIFATFGMGPDGHIAGIFPYPEDAAKFDGLFMGNEWLTAYSATGKHQYPERVTATPAFFKLINAATAYITGQEKQAVFDRLKKKQNSAFELPAMFFWEIKNLEIFTDLQ